MVVVSTATATRPPPTREREMEREAGAANLSVVGRSERSLERMASRRTTRAIHKFRSLPSRSLVVLRRVVTLEHRQIGTRVVRPLSPTRPSHLWAHTATRTHAHLQAGRQVDRETDRLAGTSTFRARHGNPPVGRPTRRRPPGFFGDNGSARRKIIVGDTRETITRSGARVH